LRYEYFWHNLPYLLRHMSSGHVTLLRREFQRFKFFSKSDLWLRADSCWALFQIFSLFIVFFFSTRHFWDASADRREILHVVRPGPNFIMMFQNFGGPSPKNFRGQKHAKFDPISDDFELWRQISPERIDIQNWTSTWSTAIRCQNSIITVNVRGVHCPPLALTQAFGYFEKSFTALSIGSCDRLLQITLSAFLSSAIVVGFVLSLR